MDLRQNKLSKREWETIEQPVSDNEKKVLKIIKEGYHNVNMKLNNKQSLFSYIKVEQNESIEYYLFQKYFETEIKKNISKYGTNIPNYDTLFAFTKNEIKKMKSTDSLRIQNLEKNITTNRNKIYEFLLIELTYELLKGIHKRKTDHAFYLYTLLQLKKASINNINRFVLKYVDSAIEYTKTLTTISNIIQNATDFIEKNKYLLEYEDKELFTHQKELYCIIKSSQEESSEEEFIPKLIFYTAPTGTGKTLSPIGLSENNRIIFVCVARHIGLALAKSAISMEKKVAFAFGCETASDIRLHYFSAINYTRHRKSGSIVKVDNSVGDNVEIMICDVQSYITAMHYMLSFNKSTKIITYWDEPTITLDYEEHDLHPIIHNNWSENKIPTVIMSCATLPTMEDLQPTIQDFRVKFENADIHRISSYDCKKSIPIINNEGYCVLPHYLYKEYDELIEHANYCLSNKTLLRYFDLEEIIKYISYINTEGFVTDENYLIDNYFEDIASITMNSLKIYYLEILLNTIPEKWEQIYQTMILQRNKKFDKPLQKIKSMEQTGSIRTTNELVRTQSINVFKDVKRTVPKSTGISLTTADAYTLTDGPTIFLTNDVNKIGSFYIKQSNIPLTVFDNILNKINENNTLVKRIDQLERQIEAKESKVNSEDNSTKSVRDSGRLSKESMQWQNEIDKLRKKVKLISLDAIYLPNTKSHQELWTPDGEVYENAFISNIGEENTKLIMGLNIENNFKVLLLLGIGVFVENPEVQYMEIMKKLADEQRLFIIIASTDYIYGTNYQFCHGFIGKDLGNMTQQKTIQSMGRIGRNNIQQSYTVRFRDNNLINNLFQTPENNIESINMSRLFVSE